MNEVIRTINLKKVYPNGTQALKGVNISVLEGEFVGIMGPSGSGKSTLLHLIGGLDKPTDGEVWTLGKRIDTLSQDELSKFRKNTIAFVFQFYYLLEDFTVLENLVLIGELAGIKNSSEKAMEIIEYLRLSHRKNHKPYQLSGGEQQRVAIGRALMLEPKLILADEPTGNLDLQEGKRIFELFLKLRSERGITFLIATHNVEWQSYFDRIIKMVDGRVVNE